MDSQSIPVISGPSEFHTNKPRFDTAWVPGALFASAAALVAWIMHLVLPFIPLLTAAVMIGVICTQLPFARGAITGVLAPGLKLVSRRFMRIGIVLLGFQLSLADVGRLGWGPIVGVLIVLIVTFIATFWIGRLFRLPGHEPLLIATGFSICGASAIGAMSGVVKAKDEETATPVALVTLCGTLAIAVLPMLWHPLNLDATAFGKWVGASVHDVGQVVATAQVAGSAALAVAVVVKLTRVIALAPMVAIASAVVRKSGDALAAGPRPALVPLFVAGFIAAILIRSFLPVPIPFLEAAATVQTGLLAVALVGLGTAVQLVKLVRTGWRALIVALLSWTIIAVLAYIAVSIT